MSSSFHSTGSAPTQRVPAWKRLGLKLKSGSEGQQTHGATTHPAAAAPSVPNHQAGLGGSTPNAKRKAFAGAAAPALDHSAKRARQDDWQHQNTSSLEHTPKKVKTVSFAADTTGGLRPPGPAAKPTPKKPKKTALASGESSSAPGSKPSVKRTATVNLEPALVYLRTWHSARESWKFNKNHQTKLLEQVFAGPDEPTIPAADIVIFYEYIRGLQGGVRARLRQLANGIRAQDMEQGATAFAGGGKVSEMVERKQKEYEEVIRMFLGRPPPAAASGKRRFDEVDYVLRAPDMEMQRRVVKRMRAETVLEELSETEASETTTATTTTATATLSTDSSVTEKGDADEGAERRLRLNDDPSHRAKRRRKARTAAVEDSSSDSDSSSSSDSDSESDAESVVSSSGGSSDTSSDSDDEDEGSGAPTGRDDDTSSSSSSSSSESDSSDDSDDD
ncbi:hypothetical protein F5Y17DRAFT_313395 [Xylariaceae sp. FL0594]|nr:hypothetical protein F5Y17DRAFT_313395 [Xylariaceae sp. FL0594]